MQDHGGLMIYVHERFDVSSPINILDKLLHHGWEYVCIEISQLIPIPQKNIIANIVSVDINKVKQVKR